MNLRLAQTDDEKNKDEIFKRLDLVASIVKDSVKIKNAEKRHILMQINNTKKNVCFKRNEKKECLLYLEDQIKQIGEDKFSYGISFNHIYQDLVVIYFELEDYEKAKEYAKLLDQQARITIKQSHNSTELVQIASEFIKKCDEMINYNKLSPIQKYKQNHPWIFSTAKAVVVVGIIGIGTFIGMKYFKN